MNLPLAGAFQAANALVAAGLALADGRRAGRGLRGAVETLRGAPGRLELVGDDATARRSSSITPTSPTRWKRRSRALRPLATARLIVVFGCGGDRDQGKRPIMGEIAARGADVVIVTDDNPRSEEPARSAPQFSPARATSAPKR